MGKISAAAKKDMVFEAYDGQRIIIKEGDNEWFIGDLLGIDGRINFYYQFQLNNLLKQYNTKIGTYTKVELDNLIDNNNHIDSAYSASVETGLITQAGAAAKDTIIVTRDPTTGEWLVGGIRTGEYLRAYDTTVDVTYE